MAAIQTSDLGIIVADPLPPDRELKGLDECLQALLYHAADPLLLDRELKVEAWLPRSGVEAGYRIDPAR